MEEITELYCQEFLVYNVHSLIHLADDAFKFGSLDNVSAFKYENYMQRIKRMLRAKDHQLAQVIRRIGEYESVQIPEPVKSFAYKVSSSWKDCGFILDSGEIASVTKTEDGSSYVTIKKFASRFDYFTTPCFSSKFCIYIVKNYLPETRINKSRLRLKVLLLPLKTPNEFLCMPFCGEN